MKATGVLFFLEDGWRLRRKTADGAPFLFSSFLDFFSSLSRLFLVSSFCEKRREREEKRERREERERREKRREKRERLKTMSRDNERSEEA